MVFTLIKESIVFAWAALFANKLRTFLSLVMNINKNFFTKQLKKRVEISTR